MNPKPLAGRRILITRARAQSSALREPLEELGAKVLELHTIEIRDPDSWQPLDDALGRMEQFDFLLLTSVNGVQRFLGRLAARGRTVAELARLQVGAIGPATAAALLRAGVRVDFVPETYCAEGLVKALDGCELLGRGFLIPRAKVARDLVPRVLRQGGAHVEVVEAYQTILPTLPAGALERCLTPPPDLVTFTSSSTALNFARLVEESGLMALGNVRAASIGPVTSQTAREMGFQVVVEAAESTMPGLVDAIRKYFRVAKRPPATLKPQLP